jgi:NAD+ synthase (glutamine-hydrolysing)
MEILRLALAQCNFSVGDFEGNVAIIRDVIRESQRLGVHVLAFPELALTGYPPEDLLLKPRFLRATEEALGKVVADVGDMVCILGTVHCAEDTYNAAAVIHNRQIITYYHKEFLPNYGVFDEKRYFKEGEEDMVLVLNSFPMGVSVCEDIWYSEGPVSKQAALGGARLLLNISSSPYHRDKWKLREHLLATRAIENHAYVAYANLVGGQDELVFDGGSMIYDPDGELIARGKFFEDDLVMADLELSKALKASLHDPRIRQERHPVEKNNHGIRKVQITLTESGKVKTSKPRIAEVLDPIEEVYQALVTGTRDYLRKNGFKKAVIGLSGGIDSSLVAVIAAEALGAENVLGVTMPSSFSSPEGIEDAKMQAQNLAIEILEIPISAPYKAYKDILEPHFAGRPEDLAEENIQARIRGNILMAISNKLGYLVLTTGNKSEMAVGYATLYGDMAGGFAVIKDVPKTLVYDLARHINRRAGRAIIPQRVIEKPPSAELKPDQKDTDSLPPYDVLDPILKAYVEEERGLDDIVVMGFDRETVRHVIRLVDRSEYKRRQAPPGIKITELAFGRDRRLPISNRFHV